MKESKLKIGEAFKFVFAEPNWVSKILTGGLVVLASILILPIPFLTWYEIAVYRNVIRGQKPILPDWVFNKANYMLGLKVLAVAVGYAVPSVILGMGHTFIFSLLRTAYSLVMLAFIPFALGRLAETEKIESAFDIKGIWRQVNNNLNDVVVFMVGTSLAGLAAMVGLLGLVVGIIFTGFWANLVQAYLGGKLYKVAKR